MSGWRRATALARKDLQVEWRGRETITMMATLALLLVLLLGFALDSSPARAPTILWVALGLAATVGVARPTQAELDEDALETLLLYPGSREDLFWGKWGSLTLILCVLLGLLLPFLAILFNMDLWRQLPAMLGVGLLGVVGLASIGTLFAALTLQVRGRELLMPVLLLPVALPVILAGIRLTEAILDGGAWIVWLEVLGTFDLLFVLVAPILFSVVMEEV
jgi:heme exporter protein CcmB